MSEELFIDINADMSDAYIEIANLQKALDEVGREAVDRRREVLSELNVMLSAFNTGLNLMKNAFVMMGGTLEPIQEAALTVIFTTIQQMRAVATAYATMGPVGIAAAVIVGVASIAFSIKSQADMLAGMTAAKTQMNAGIAAMNNIQSLISTAGRNF